MKWALTQRWAGVALLALIVLGSHVAARESATAKALSMALLAAASAHVAASLYVVLTDYRPFASRARVVGATAILLGASAFAYGAWVIVRSSSPPPILGHLPGSECRACHDRDEHRRWPLELHAAKGERRGVDCEGCHAVDVASPDLLASRDPESGRAVAAVTAVDACLDCHGPKSEERAWPGAIHEAVKCGTCHSRAGTAAEPSWKRACAKCHPREDDPHGDVRTLDTTFASPSSRADVHTMTCAACHSSADRR